MPAPSPLAIATSVLNRLVKEEVSYHKELEQQNVKIAKLEAGEGADDENADFILRQQVCVLVLLVALELIWNLLVFASSC
jgi:tubulin-specific chaperone A